MASLDYTSSQSSTQDSENDYEPRSESESESEHGSESPMPDMDTVEPYMYEPEHEEHGGDSSASTSDENEATSGIERLGNTDW